MINTLAKQLSRHPTLGARLDQFWELVGGVSIRTKIMGIILTLTITLGLGVTLLVRQAMTQTLLNELENRGHSVVSDLAARSAAFILADDIAGLQRLLDETLANHPDTRYAFVIDAGGDVVAHTFSESVPSEILMLSASDHPGDEHHIHYENYEGQVHDFTLPILAGPGQRVRLGLAETRLQEIIDDVTTWMLIATILVALIGIGAASLLTWLLTRPILDLVGVTEGVRQGDLSVRAPHWTDDEIGTLADAFNQLIVELEASQQAVAEKEAVRTRLLAKLINAQEEERKLTARELHDGVGQALTSLLVGIKVLAQTDDWPVVRAKAAELRQITSETLQAVRLLSRQLRPSALDDLGLAAALERYATEFSNQYPELAVDLHCDLPTRLAATIETPVYRIVQEAMTNAARHSQADTLSILITQRKGKVQAIIEDNGHGFDPVAVRRHANSVGLHSMAERAELLDGQLEIESNNEGTTIYVEIPL